MSILIPPTLAADAASIAAIERETGPLPATYRLFLQDHDGAIPEANTFGSFSVNG